MTVMRDKFFATGILESTSNERTRLLLLALSAVKFEAQSAGQKVAKRIYAFACFFNTPTGVTRLTFGNLAEPFKFPHPSVDTTHMMSFAKATSKFVLGSGEH